jgi:hypothetical protein
LSKRDRGPFQSPTRRSTLVSSFEGPPKFNLHFPGKDYPEREDATKVHISRHFSRIQIWPKDSLRLLWNKPKKSSRKKKTREKLQKNGRYFSRVQIWSKVVRERSLAVK